MRIVYLHQYFVPRDGSGGTRSYEFARRLIADGHEVTMITSSAHLDGLFERSGRVTRCRIADIPCIVIDVPYSNEMSFPRRIWAFTAFAFLASLQAMRQPADVIFATSTPLTIAIPAILGKLWRRAPMVFEVRDLWPEMPIAVGALRNPIAKASARLLEWLAYRSSRHVIALSPGMAEGIERRGVSPEHITIIPNSSDIDLFDVPEEAGGRIRAELNLCSTQSLILYAGTFGIINNVSYLVDVASAMRDINPDCHFLLVGSGAQNDVIRQKAKSCGVLGHNLTIWQSRPKRDMPAILSAATIATSIFLPIDEMQNNSANKFFDALAAGRPIAINHGGWQADLLRETGCGLILPAQDIQQAAKMLDEAIHSPDWLQSASMAARQLAAERFNRDQLYEKLSAVLTDVTSSS